MKRRPSSLVFASVVAGAALVVAACDGFSGDAPSPEREAGSDSAPSLDASPTGDGGVEGDALVDAAPADCTVRCLSKSCEDDGGCDPLVFVTNDRYTGDFSGVADVSTTAGLDRADELCRREIGDAGVFRAWLSTASKGALARVTSSASERPLYRKDGMRIANRPSDLLDGGPLVPINLSPTNVPVGDTENVWTGTLETGGPSTQNCKEWSSTNGYKGQFGRPGSESWTAIGATASDPGQDCTVPAHLYCFEIVPE